MNGIELIAAERQRHFELGFDAQHDDEHGSGELAQAAMAYIQADDVDVDFKKGERTPYPPGFMLFPWGAKYWKPKDRIANLKRAGAFIAAEIDRLQRAAVLKGAE